MCLTAFSMIKGKNASFTHSDMHSAIDELQSSWLNFSVDLQLHFTGQHGQHLPKCGPAGGGWERGDAIQAGLPPGE